MVLHPMLHNNLDHSLVRLKIFGEIFGTQGITPIRPMGLLAGPNSAGKEVDKTLSSPERVRNLFPRLFEFSQAKSDHLIALFPHPTVISLNNAVCLAGIGFVVSLYFNKSS